VFLHRDPTYSFRIPDGWRQATAENAESIGWVRFELKLATAERQAKSRQGLQTLMKQADAILVSPGGAAIVLVNAPNREGLRIPARGVLSAKEEAVFLAGLTKRVSDAIKKEGTSDFTIESADLVEYGPLPATLIKSRLFARMTVRMLFLAGSSHGVLVMHFGIPEEDDEGLLGFEELAKSFRFEETGRAEAPRHQIPSVSVASIDRVRGFVAGSPAPAEQPGPGGGLPYRGRRLRGRGAGREVRWRAEAGPQ
jgi:hypothetical protein